ncbi:Hypothetical Protein FCC1311_097502 [Hondaea fermentalgiana]|uniref:Uncharacterized protein n=1 Tax=Hondaea fermentalgiana TaxID=2315210 RepID=A0A2R5GRM3_9STRA|nr:Hypothetical Protein FCC1311_097502 [Hondaea fermentalgiana]|eukprot:GBG33527.1 Hypothetical Protein FCC1311_097502 [Hondaea fermentalgiana]
MGQNTSKEGEDQEALAEQCFHRKASFVEAIMALVGLGGGRLTRADSNETLHMESDESDDDSVGRSRRGSGAVAAGAAKASASPHVRRRSSMNTRPSPPYNAPKNADAVISDIKRPSLASIGSGISQRRTSVSELLDVERKEDEEDLELLSHLQTNSEYSDETTETYLTEDQELLLLRRAADAWEKKDISAITDCESEIRVKLLDPKKDSREALENEVMLLRQQLESKNSEMMRLKSSSVSGVSTSELYLIDSMSTTSDNFSESDAFSSVSGAFSSVSGAGYL